MDSLPPIPTPTAAKWREFRVRFLPLIFFVCVTIGAALVWRNYLQPVTIVGQVETNCATVISIQDGTLVELAVNLLDRVSKDDVIGSVAIADPAVTQSSLEVIAADLRLMQARMDLDKVRNLDSYARLRVDLLAEKTALALAQVRVKQAEAELKMAKDLFQQGLIPKGSAVGQGNIFGVEVAQRDRDLLEAEIEKRTQVIAEYQAKIATMETAGSTNMPARDPVIEEAIKTQQEQLQLQAQPVKLKAPLDGVVNLVLKHAGEKVVRGAAILTVCPISSQYIVGHIRQPLSRLPTTNDFVVIRTRGTPRQQAGVPILRVGSQLEPINPFLLSPDGTRQEIGLPILLGIPQNLQSLLRGGEFVDLSIQYSPKK